MTTRNRTMIVLALAGVAIALSFVIGGSTAQGALVTNMSASAPTTNVAISQTAASSNVQFQWHRPAGTDNNPRDAGQSFLVGAGGLVLDKITVKIPSLNTSKYDSDSMTAEIFTLTDGSDFTPNSTVLSEGGSFPSNMKSSFDGGNTYLTFDITDVALSASTQYGFLLMFDSQNDNVQADDMRLAAVANTVANYTGGIGLVRQNFVNGEMSVWTGVSTPADLEFYLQAVPEPSTFVLAAFGLLSLIGFARRRRR